MPFLEQEELYEKFNLDEPWYSPNNRELIQQMPWNYASPTSRFEMEEGKTHFLAVYGPDAMFYKNTKLDYGDISDGSSNTIMLVEAGHDRAVIWTKPEDYDLDPEYPIAGLVDLHPKE